MQIQRVATPAITIDGIAKQTGNAKIGEGVGQGLPRRRQAVVFGRSKWDIQCDANTGTYTCRNGSITDVITGAESIKGWNGKTLRATRVV